MIHEDADLLLINKPAGLITSSGPRDNRLTAWSAAQLYIASQNGRAGLIHRLDRGAAGLLIFSKNAAAFSSLKKQFFHHSVERIYHALVHGVPKRAKDRIESRLVEWPDGSVHSTRRRAAGDHAITEYEVLGASDDQSTSLLRVKLQTGRKHQIRVHLSEMENPIVNDRVYGKAPVRGNLMLIATELAFDHPRSCKRLRFTLPLPRQMRVKLRASPREATTG